MYISLVLWGKRGRVEMERDKVEGMKKILHKYFLLQEQPYRDSPISNTIGKKYNIFILKTFVYFLFFSCRDIYSTEPCLYTGPHTGYHFRYNPCNNNRHCSLHNLVSYIVHVQYSICTCTMSI